MSTLPTLSALMADYEKKANEVQAILAAGNDLTQELFEKAQGINKEIEGLAGQIQTAREVEALRSANNGRIADMKTVVPPVPHAAIVQTPHGTTTINQGPEAGTTVFERTEKGTSLLYQDGEALMSLKQYAAISTKSYKDAWRLYLRYGKEIGPTDWKVLQEGLDQSGGYLAPPDMIERLIMKRPAPTRVAGLVTDIPTSRDSIVMPRVVYSTDDIYTTGIRVTASGEIPASAQTIAATDPVFGQIQIPVLTWMLSNRVTNDMVEDAMFPLLPWMEARYNETIDLLYDDQILNGTGVGGRPRGILVAPGVGDEPAIVNVGAASVVTADGLMTMSFSVPEQYLDNLRWVLNYTNTARVIALLKDAENRYLFSMGMQDNGLVAPRERTLLGFPMIFSAFMPNQGSNTNPIIFGDLRGYYLVRRIGFTVQVLRELYAETNQQVMLGRLRFGGATAEGFRLKIGRTPA